MKLMIIGLGFLARYAMPCYEKLLGEDFPRNVVGIKGSSRDLEQVQSACPFPVQVGGTAEMLRSMEPDLIVLGVRPHQIPGVVREELAPYYEECRRKGKKLPDLYSFAPDPTVDFYYDTLGPDVNEANQLPSMTKEVCGYPTAEAGVSFVAFDPRRQWPEENKKRAREFLQPTGTVLEVEGSKTIPFLASQVVSHLMFDLSFLVEDVLKEFHIDCPHSEAAGSFRRMHRQIWDAPCARVVPETGADVPEAVRGFQLELLQAWHQGVLRLTELEGIPRADAWRMSVGSAETYLMVAQLESRAQLMEDIRNHATPGGFLEMCMKTFYDGGSDRIKEGLRRRLRGQPDDSFAADTADIAFRVTKAISDHGRTVSGVHPGKI